MTSGEVTPNREAVIGLNLGGVDGRTLQIEAVLDTGFTEFISLPAATILQLGWSKLYPERMMLANRSIVTLDVYDGIVLWEGQKRHVEVHAAEEALIGMSMLYGSRVTLDVVDGGPVSITPL